MTHPKAFPKEKPYLPFADLAVLIVITGYVLSISGIVLASWYDQDQSSPQEISRQQEILKERS